MRQFTIGHEAVFFERAFLMSFGDMPPRSEVNFVDGDGRTQLLPLITMLHPRSVLPPVLVYVGYNTGCTRAQLRGEAIGVGLLNRIVIET